MSDPLFKSKTKQRSSNTLWEYSNRLVVVFRWNVHVHSIVLDYTRLSNIVFISVGKIQTLIGLHDSLLCYAAFYLSFQYLFVSKIIE